MSDYAVTMMLKAKDLVSGAFGKASKAARMFESRTTRAFKQASKAGSHFRGVLKGVLTAFVIRRGLSDLQMMIADNTRAFLDFDQAIWSAASRVDGFDFRARSGVATLNELRDAALDLSEKTQFMASDSAMALDKLTLAGLGVKQAIAVLGPGADLATVAQTDLNTAVGMSVDMLGALKLKANDTKVMYSNLIRLNDVLASTVTSSNVTLEQLYETVTSGGAQFVGVAKQSLPTFFSFAAALADAGVKGEEAGVAIRNFGLRLGNPTKEASKFIKALRIKTSDKNKDFLDFINIVDMLRTSTEKLGSAKKTKIFAEIFGVRTATASAILTSTTVERLKELYNTIDKSQGKMKKQSDIIRQSMKIQWMLVLSALESKFIRLFYRFDKDGRGVLFRLKKYIDGISIDLLEKRIRKFGYHLETIKNSFKEIFEPLKPLVRGAEWAFKKLSDIMDGDLSSAIWGVTYAFIGWKAIQSALKITAFIGAVASAGGFLAKFGVVLSGVPWGAIAIAIGFIALVALPLMAQHLDKIIPLVEKLYDVHPWFLMGKAIDWVAHKLETGILYVFRELAKALDKVNKFLGPLMDKYLGPSIHPIEPTPWFKEFVNPQSTPAPVAPNKSQVEAQRISFNGTLDINGAPKGSTIRSTTRGSAPIRTNLIGMTT